jgi:hypothetical protein
MVKIWSNHHQLPRLIVFSTTSLSHKHYQHCSWWPFRDTTVALQTAASTVRGQSNITGVSSPHTVEAAAMQIEQLRTSGFRQLNAVYRVHHLQLIMHGIQLIFDVCQYMWLSNIRLIASTEHQKKSEVEERPLKVNIQSTSDDCMGKEIYIRLHFRGNNIKQFRQREDHSTKQ